MTEDESVQTPEPVEVATGEPEGETPKVETEEKPLTLSQVQEMISSAQEEARKHFQSIADRDIKAARSESKKEKRAREDAEAQLRVFQEMASRDPKMASQMKYAKQAAKASAYDLRQSIDQAEQDKKEYIRANSEILENAGIAIDDKDIDWGLDEATPVEAQAKFNKSYIKKVAAMKKASDAAIKQQIKDEIANARKNAGLDSVDTTQGGGSGNVDDAEWLVKYGNGEVPFTQENLDRANKIMDKEK